MKNFLTAIITAAIMLIAPVAITPASAAPVAPITKTVSVATAKVAPKVSINIKTTNKTKSAAWTAFDKNVASGKINMAKVTKYADRIAFIGTSKAPINSKSIISAKLGKTYYVFTATKSAKVTKIDASEFKTLASKFKACKTEDSNVCYWNSKTKGNKKGKSFIALNDSMVLFSK